MHAYVCECEESDFEISNLDQCLQVFVSVALVERKKKNRPSAAVVHKYGNILTFVHRRTLKMHHSQYFISVLAHQTQKGIQHNAEVV